MSWASLTEETTTNRIPALSALPLLLLIAGTAAAEPRKTFVADLQPLNGSGVLGTVTVLLDTDQLTVTVQLIRLEPNQVHPQHIDGSADDMNSTCPPMSADTDGDGYVELAEGLPFYGPVSLGLMPFPRADANGNVFFTQTYTLGSAGVPGAESMWPLQNRVIVVHGLSVPAVGESTPGEVDGSAGYKPVLPVACGALRLQSSHGRKDR